MKAAATMTQRLRGFCLSQLSKGPAMISCGAQPRIETEGAQTRMDCCQTLVVAIVHDPLCSLMQSNQSGMHQCVLSVDVGSFGGRISGKTGVAPYIICYRVGAERGKDHCNISKNPLAAGSRPRVASSLPAAAAYKPNTLSWSLKLEDCLSALLQVLRRTSSDL